MIFAVDWRQFWLIVLPLTIAVLCVLLISQATPKPLWVRILIVFTAVPLLLVTSAVTAFLLWMTLSHPQVVSQPIHSPDGKLAARVETWEGFFAPDAGTNVKIYSLHGLHSAWPYSGGEGSVAPENVRWIDDHTLEIRYTYDHDHTCDSTQQIRVVCLPLNAPAR